MFFSANDRQKLEQQRLFWWEPNDKRINVGDYLSRVIVADVLALRDLEIVDKLDKRLRLFAIGSVLHFAQSNECVWGSGVNGKIDSSLHKFSTLDVRAVRGPLTRAFLQDRQIPVPEVYGDPALLMPLFYRADLLQPERGIIPFVIVPHLHESPEKFARYEQHLVLPTSKPATFVSQLLRARLVISSSLHGLILAEAYGIPAIFVDTDNGESPFKYDDYYFGTSRMHYRTARSIEAALEMGGNDLFDLEAIQHGLLAAFPWDLWPQ